MANAHSNLKDKEVKNLRTQETLILHDNGNHKSKQSFHTKIYAQEKP